MRLIDADELRDDWLQNGENEYVYDTNAFLESIDNAPTVDAVPVRHGKWIEHKRAEEYCGELISNYECSECHEWFREWGHYCSDCGAKMDGS